MSPINFSAVKGTVQQFTVKLKKLHHWKYFNYFYFQVKSSSFRVNLVPHLLPKISPMKVCELGLTSDLIFMER